MKIKGKKVDGASSILIYTQKELAAAFPLVLFKVVSLDLLRSQEEKRKACSIWVLLSIMN